MRRREAVAIAAILLLALGLRLYHLDAQSLWNDEGTSVALAQRDLATIARHASYDIHPPLYYYLLHGWIAVAGTSEVAVRSLSVVAGVGLVAGVWALARRLAGAVAAALAALLAAVAPFGVYYSQEARMYIWAALFGLLATIAFERLLGGHAGASRASPPSSRTPPPASRAAARDLESRDAAPAAGDGGAPSWTAVGGAAGGQGPSAGLGAGGGALSSRGSPPASRAAARGLESRGAAPAAEDGGAPSRAAVGGAAGGQGPSAGLGAGGGMAASPGRRTTLRWPWGAALTIAYGLAAVAAIYSHYLGATVLVAHNLAFIAWWAWRWRAAPPPVSALGTTHPRSTGERTRRRGGLAPSPPPPVSALGTTHPRSTGERTRRCGGLAPSPPPSCIRVGYNAPPEYRGEDDAPRRPGSLSPYSGRGWGRGEAWPILAAWALLQAAIVLAYVPWLAVSWRSLRNWPAVSADFSVSAMLGDALRALTWGPAAEVRRMTAAVALGVAALGLPGLLGAWGAGAEPKGGAAPRDSRSLAAARDAGGGPRDDEASPRAPSAAEGPCPPAAPPTAARDGAPPSSAAGAAPRESRSLAAARDAGGGARDDEASPRAPSPAEGPCPRPSGPLAAARDGAPPSSAAGAAPRDSRSLAIARDAGGGPRDEDGDVRDAGGGARGGETGVIAGVRSDPTPRWFGAVLLALYLVTPIGLMALASLGRPMYKTKFVLLAAPPFYVLVAAGVVTVGRWVARLSRRRGAGIAMACLLALGTLAPAARGLARIYWDPATYRDDYRAIAAHIAATAGPDDAILINAPSQIETFGYYYRGPLPEYPLPRQRPIDAVDTLAELEAMAARHDRIYAVLWATDESDPERVIEGWLDAHAFKAMDRWFGDVRLAMYALPRSPEGAEVVPAGHELGGQVRLRGYSILTPEPAGGDVLQVALHWESLSPIAARYKVFVHLVDAAGTIVSQRDSEPGGGARLTSDWAPGEEIIDLYGLLIPPDTPPGEHLLRVGMYGLDGGQRLPVALDGQTTGDAIDLTRVTIRAEK